MLPRVLFRVSGYWGRGCRLKNGFGNLPQRSPRRFTHRSQNIGTTLVVVLAPAFADVCLETENIAGHGQAVCLGHSKGWLWSL